MTSVALSALMLYAPAMAQEAEAPAGDDTIVVTGTRIATRDAIAESPIFSIESDVIVDSGYVTVEQYINTLPQVVASISSQSNNPSSSGRAFIDLRGLGANRNLILMDGRRLVGQAAGGTIVDVNTIPAALIERVEIITGGASAVYGPDAVAGVVNFIMKKSFDGFQLDGQYRLTELGDGQEYNVDATYGSDFADGRGSAVFNASYFNRSEIFKDGRPFAEQAGNVTSIFPGGSWSTGSNQPTLAAVNGIFGANLCNTNGGNGGFGFNPDGSLFCTGVSGNPNRNVVNYNGPQEHIATAFFPDRFSYNFEPDNKLVLPLERLSFYSHFDLDLYSWFQPYAMAMFTNYSAQTELAATPAAGFTVPVTNPFIPADLAVLLASRPIQTFCFRDPEAPPIPNDTCGTAGSLTVKTTDAALDGEDVPGTGPNADFSLNKRFNFLGGRVSTNNHNVWQTVAGVKGDIWQSWKYDAYVSYGKSDLLNIQDGNVRVLQVEALLDDPAGGAGDPNDPENVPVLCEGGWNPFGLDPVSEDCKDFMTLRAKNSTLVEQIVVEGVVTGDIFELPAGPVSTAWGVSYRDLDFDFVPDSGLQPGLVAGFNAALPVSGDLQYTDLFMEMRIPLLKDLPFTDSVSVTGGFRSTNTSNSGPTETWKLTGDWTAADWLRFRGGYQFAVRAPNIAELFQPQVPNFPNYEDQDPCNTTGDIFDDPEMGRNGPNGAQVTALCAAQAAPAGDPSFVQPFGQAQAIVGGNPDLEPEEASTWTVGAVFQSPSKNPWLERLALSVDYWNIKLEEAISAVNAVTIIQRCFNRDGANPTYDPNNSWCQLFDRDQADGRVINLLQLSQNQALIHTSGIDVTLTWGFDLGEFGFSGNPGNLDFVLAGTWLEQFKTQTTSIDPIEENAGTISQVTASAFPEFKAVFDTTYSRDDLRVTVRTRYLDAMRHFISGGTGVPATWYVDLLARYQFSEHIAMRFGINNLLDQDPRLYSPFVQANTDPSTYDVLGRRYYFGFTFNM